MTALSPEGRAYREQAEAEAAAENEGVYSKIVLAMNLRAGKMTYDEVLAIVAAGRIRYRPLPYARDTVDYDEQTANSHVEPFAALEGKDLTTEQVEALYAAEDAAFGSKAAATPVESEDAAEVPQQAAAVTAAADGLPEPPVPAVAEPSASDSLSPEEARFEASWDPYGNYNRWFLVLNDPRDRTSGARMILRARNGLIQQWQPESQVWIEAAYQYDLVYGPDKIEAAMVDYGAAWDAAQAGLPIGDRTAAEWERSATAAARPRTKNGPYWDE